MANYGITTTDLIAADTPHRDVLMDIVAGANHVRNGGQVGTGFYDVFGEAVTSPDAALAALLNRLDEAGAEPTEACYWVADLDSGQLTRWKVSVTIEDGQPGYDVQEEDLSSGAAVPAVTPDEPTPEDEPAEAEGTADDAAAEGQDDDIMQAVSAEWPYGQMPSGVSRTDYLIVPLRFGISVDEVLQLDPRNMLRALVTHLGCGATDALTGFAPSRYLDFSGSRWALLEELDFEDGELRAANIALSDGAASAPAYLAFPCDYPEIRRVHLLYPTNTAVHTLQRVAVHTR